eukprot:407658-Amorphochlora_amoeboformis.AAC.1
MEDVRERIKVRIKVLSDKKARAVTEVEIRLYTYVCMHTYTHVYECAFLEVREEERREGEGFQRVRNVVVLLYTNIIYPKSPGQPRPRPRPQVRDHFPSIAYTPSRIQQDLPSNLSANTSPNSSPDASTDGSPNRASNTRAYAPAYAQTDQRTYPSPDDDPEAYEWRVADGGCKAFDSYMCVCAFWMRGEGG